MREFNTYEVVEKLISEYNLNTNDNKRTVFSKVYEYFYDYFMSAEEQNCVIAMESANNVASDSEILNKVYNEIKERSYGTQ